MAKATEDDTVLARVYQFIKQGWLESKSKLEKALHPYFVKRFELTIQRVYDVNNVRARDAVTSYVVSLIVPCELYA